MRLRTALMAAVASLTLIASANATPLAAGSQISFSDGANYNSTSITFLNGGAANISANVSTGSFAPFSAGCTGCAQFTSFSFNPFTSGTQVYTASLGGLTTTFTLNALTSTTATANFLDVEGTGTVTLSGFDPTPGVFFLSSQGGQNMNVTFSATTRATAVPEPTSLMILGAGMIGLGALRRRRKN